MTPQDAALIAALTALLKDVGTWPLLTVVLTIMVGPYLFLFFFSRTQEQRLAAMTRMYEDNVGLVKDYEDKCRALIRIAEDQQAAAVGMTQSLTRLHDAVSTNQFCPAARIEKKRVEVGT